MLSVPTIPGIIVMVWFQHHILILPGYITQWLGRTGDMRLHRTKLPKLHGRASMGNSGYQYDATLLLLSR
jgi:hypothetical protein